MENLIRLVPAGYSDWGVVLSVGILFVTTTIAAFASRLAQSDTWFQNLDHPRLAFPPRLTNIIAYGACILFGIAAYDVWAWADERYRPAAIALYVLLVVFSIAGPFAFFIAHAITVAACIRVLYFLLASCATGVFFAAANLAGWLMTPVAVWALYEAVVGVGYARARARVTLV